MEHQLTLFTIKSFFRRWKVFRLPILLCSNTLAVMLILVTLYSTIQNTTTKNSKQTYGSWNFAVYNANKETVHLLEDNALISQIGTMTIYGKVGNNINGKSNYIGTVDHTTLSLISISFEQGRYPENPSEIALEKELLLALGISNTLGTKVTLPCSNGSGTTKELTFRLCGVINSYHNNYLKQGPLVSAFVNTYCEDFMSEPIYTNNFIQLKNGYANDQIVAEIHNSTLDKDTTQKEKWYYNTYIETPLQLHYATLFIMSGIGMILLATIYWCFLSYYSSRYQILTGSQLLVLDTKKILRIFRLEAFILFPIITVIGCLKAVVFSWILYRIARMFSSEIVFSISPRYILLILGLSLLCMITINMVSRMHSYSLNTRQPVIHFPSASAKSYKRQQHRFPYIMKRIVLVYKRSLFHHVIWYTVIITTIFIFTSSAYYTYNSVMQLRLDTKADYGIKKLNDVNQLTNQLEQIQNLPEVASISYYRYLTIDSILFVELKGVKDPPSNGHCFVSLPPDSKQSSLTVKNNIVNLTLNNKSYCLKIDPCTNRAYTNTNSPFIEPASGYLYCNEELFNSIMEETGVTALNYIAISYNKEYDHHVATNIIDTILFGNHSFVTIHNVIDSEEKCTTLLINEGIVTILCLLNFLTSFMILKNQQKAGLHYLRKEIKIIWTLGFEKNSLRIYLLVLNLVCIAISSCISFCLVYLFYHWEVRYSEWLFPHTIKYFYMTPNLVFLSLLLLFFYCLVYLSYLTKDINQIIEKF